MHLVVEISGRCEHDPVSPDSAAKSECVLLSFVKENTLGLASSPLSKVLLKRDRHDARGVTMNHQTGVAVRHWHPFMASRATASRLKSVLVVDDDAELCGLIGDVLKTTAEFQVEAVHDGRRGLALAFEPRFDLVILDVMLPVVDGFEVLKQIRKRSRVPVILPLSARG